MSQPLPWRLVYQNIGLCLRFSYLMPNTTASHLKVLLSSQSNGTLVWHLTGYHGKEWSRAQVSWTAQKGTKVSELLQLTKDTRQKRALTTYKLNSTGKQMEALNEYISITLFTSFVSWRNSQFFVLFLFSTFLSLIWSIIIAFSRPFFSLSSYGNIQFNDWVCDDLLPVVVSALLRNYNTTCGIRYILCGRMADSTTVLFNLSVLTPHFLDHFWGNWYSEEQH